MRNKFVTLFSRNRLIAIFGIIGITGFLLFWFRDRLYATPNAPCNTANDCFPNENCFQGVCIPSTCGNGICEPTDEPGCPDCVSSICGNGICETGESNSSCPMDCPSSSVCGNGICETNETSFSCPPDCSASPICGNKVCEFGENSQTCPLDCPATVCGNGICETNENSVSCPPDCPSSPTCGNFVCDPYESPATCPIDCAASTCGNGICDSGESIFTCPSDCNASADTDHDGILDAFDNCPNDYNPNQKDFDQDFKGDICDPPNSQNCDQLVQMLSSSCKTINPRIVSKIQNQCNKAVQLMGTPNRCENALPRLERIRQMVLAKCAIPSGCNTYLNLLQGMIDYAKEKATHHCCAPGYDQCGKKNGCSLVLTDPNNCGACGAKCPNRPHALSSCASGVCQYATCEPGYYDIDFDPSNGCEYYCPTKPGPEICGDNIDNDCDGTIDNPGTCLQPK